jgi:dTDP-4-amino-4,6-dideoxygalactose transaminase
MTWPSYSPACRRAVEVLLRKGGSLSAYRANPKFPSWTGPQEGSYAYKLEREVEKKFKVKHAVAVNSGTAALHASLVSVLRGGGEVVTSPYTFSATASAILLSGYTPVFADVDPYTFCISKETVKRVITRKTKAILPVHLFGGLADVRSLRSFGLPVIEDACQAVGARSGDGYSGTTGLAGAYSFNGGKNVPAGEAGMLVTNSDKVAESARLLMNHGENFHQKQVGLNYRPNELTACVAYHGLLELEERNQRRRDLVKELIIHTDARWPALCLGTTLPTHVYYVYPFLLRGFDRSKFIKRMARMGIPVGAGYITPTLDKYKAFRKYARGPLPVVEELSKKTLCILSTLTPDRELSYSKHVAECMRKALR